MDVAALIVAIVALLFAVSAAGFGVYIQFQTYKATTDHLRGVEGSVSGFRTDMQGLVGELKGMTDTLVEAQQHQFNRMLDAFVTRPGAAAEVAEKTGESAGTLQQISEEMDALKEEIRQAASADEVQRKLEELAGRIEAVSESTARAARLAEVAARPGVGLPGPETRPFVGHGMMHVEVEGFGRYVVDVVDLLKEVRDNEGRADSSRLRQWHAAKMVSPRQAVEIALREQLLSTHSDGHATTWLSLTDKGRQVLEIIEAAAP